MRAFVSLASKAALAMPRVKGLGLGLEYASRAFAGFDGDVVTRFEGSFMEANPSIVDGRRLLFTSRYHDRVERDFVRSVLRPGDYAVDLGANVGLYTLLFSRLVGPRGQVTAIEAEPVNAARLRRNIALNSYSNINVEQFGASDKRETLALHLSATNLGMHSFVGDKGKGDTPVECRPLSELLFDREPRFLKIDIEGFEYPVLKRYFADKPRLPKYIMVEDWPDLRLGNAVELCITHGYKVVNRQSPNVMLSLPA